jgi:hypothetical protein
MVAQSAAFHMRLPGNVVLLLFGVLLGPDGLGLIRPDALGTRFRESARIAVILKPDSPEWRRAPRIHDYSASGHRGSIVTWAGAARGALRLGWDWHSRFCSAHSS